MIDEEKRALRQRVLLQREAMDETQRERASAQIRERLLDLPAVRAADSVFCFVSFGSEVDTHPLLDAFLGMGCAVTVPRITGPAAMEAVPMEGWDDLVPGQWGILEPRRRDRAEGPFDVAVVPGVAFNAAGARLGMGRGYYDRWLASHDVGLAVSPAFECQLAAWVPEGPMDLPVDCIVTEQQVLRPSVGA